MSKEKHEQFTPNGREPSSLALFDENLAVSISENKDYKSKYVMYVEQKRRVNNCSYLSLYAGENPLLCVSNKGLLSVSYRDESYMGSTCFLISHRKNSDIFQ